MAALRLCLLTPGMPRPGDPVLEQAARLAADHGHDVTLALTDATLPDDEEARVGAVRAIGIAAAEGERFDVAMSTGWTTTVHLFGVPAERRASLVSALEHQRMGTWQPERLPAALSYDLPVDFVATAAWVRDALAELRPDARVLLARAGVDKELFAAAAGGDGAAAGEGSARRALRVVVDDRHAPDRAVSFERRALAAATEPVDAVFVEPGDDARRRAEMLAAADVVLHLPAEDGVLGAPLEGFHAGATAIVTGTADQPDVVRHGENGLVVDHDDERGAAAQLDRLARDGDLLESLRAEARRTAESWPSAGEGAAELSAALEEIAASPPPEDVRWPVRLMADAVAGAAVLRRELALVGEEVERHRGDELYRVAVRVRARWEREDMAGVRRLAAPVLRRARARLLR